MVWVPRTFMALLLVSLLFTTAVAAAETSNPIVLNNQGIYEKSLAALTLLFVVAVLLEHAFATIFNWRVFLAYFSRTGAKTIIMVAVSLVVVNKFEIDIVASLMSAYKSNVQDSAALSKFITALILASGSTGVFNIMRALGYRTENREVEMEAKAPVDQAWVAVQVGRKNAVGDFHVKIRNLSNADSASNAPAPIAGTIASKRPSLFGLIFRKANRFPQNGGYVLMPNVVYEITVECKDKDGAELKALGGTTYVFAPRAVVDFTVSL